MPLLFGVILFFLSTGGYGYAAATKPLPEIQPQLRAVEAVLSDSPELAWPAGQGVVGTVKDGVLAASSENEQVKPIASMTKLITALAVLEKSPMNPGDTGNTYIITSNDVSVYSSYIAKLGTVMPVRTGQELTQYHALQGLLLPSANNIADLLAEREFGSMDNYINYANTMLASYSLENTTVADASGFSPDTVSTPSDMFEIGRRALAHPVIAEIVAQREAYIPVSGLIRNTNQLLMDESVIGLKTGTTDEAGSCLLFAFNHTLGDGSSETVVATVMGVPSWPQLYREVRVLMEGARQGFVPIEIAGSQQVVGEYLAPWGQEADIITSEAFTKYGWAGRSWQPEAEVEALAAPVESGTEVGRLKAGDDFVMLETNGAIDGPSLWWRLVNYW